MTDEHYLAMAALDRYPVPDDGLPKSTSVVFRIHQLGHALEAKEKALTTAEAVVGAAATTVRLFKDIIEACDVEDASDCIVTIQQLKDALTIAERSRQ